MLKYGTTLKCTSSEQSISLLESVPIAEIPSKQLQPASEYTSDTRIGGIKMHQLRAKYQIVLLSLNHANNVSDNVSARIST